MKKMSGIFSLSFFVRIFPSSTLSRATAISSRLPQKKNKKISSSKGQESEFLVMPPTWQA
ncbi:hypothetical protein [Parachryseolinea silvisoli]|uniref:hypothetical protein n=1 Tax=Parachryseolinea silvisoli TaxID=2873601 RepID=UPI002265D07A|nr:hypothetical protein [Parachryseolinea silvisoli]MCD9015108.1 hypothetical protein [Parachryseolinea silvisoli]